jgi:hypothetical protein
MGGAAFVPTHRVRRLRLMEAGQYRRCETTVNFSGDRACSPNAAGACTSGWIPLPNNAHRGKHPSEQAPTAFRCAPYALPTVTRAAETSASASVAYFTSCLLRNGPKLNRVVPPQSAVPMAACASGAQWMPDRVRIP